MTCEFGRFLSPKMVVEQDLPFDVITTPAPVRCGGCCAALRSHHADVPCLCTPAVGGAVVGGVPDAHCSWLHPLRPGQHCHRTNRSTFHQLLEEFGHLGSSWSGRFVAAFQWSVNHSAFCFGGLCFGPRDCSSGLSSDVYVSTVQDIDRLAGRSWEHDSTCAFSVAGWCLKLHVFQLNVSVLGDG